MVLGLTYTTHSQRAVRIDFKRSLGGRTVIVTARRWGKCNLRGAVWVVIRLTKLDDVDAYSESGSASSNLVLERQCLASTIAVRVDLYGLVVSSSLSPAHGDIRRVCNQFPIVA